VALGVVMPTPGLSFTRDTAQAMSQENVEIVRRGYEAYARGDVAVMLADVDQAMVTYREEPDGATFNGRDGLLQAIAEWVEDFDEFVATAEELIDANDRQVVVHVHQTATGSQSGAAKAAPSKPPGCGSREILRRRRSLRLPRPSCGRRGRLIT
jgi:ketosteroid isomerase-like protein